VGSDAPKGEHDYLAREAKARVQIDKQLAAAGCVIQSQNALNLSAGPGVAVREFTLEKPYGRVDYILILFLNGQPAGVIEAKPEGTTLVEVEHQSGSYVQGLPDWMRPLVYPLPFIYESTGAETRFTNGYHGCLALPGKGREFVPRAQRIAGSQADQGPGKAVSRRSIIRRGPGGVHDWPDSNRRTNFTRRCP